MNKKVLSIDGGGVRGLIPAIILKEIEDRKSNEAGERKKIHELFDVITGTSTGAVITLLATRKEEGTEPYSADEIIEIYKEALPKFFTRRFGFGLTKPKYKSGPAEAVFKEHLGDAQLKDAAKPVLIPIFALRDKVPRVLYFTKLGASNDAAENFPMWQVARGATAAPTYHKAFNVTSVNGNVTHCAIDGGVYANNPAAHGWLHAHQLFDAGLPTPMRRFRLPKNVNVKETLVVSIGTGRNDEPFLHENAANWGILGWARPILDVMFEGQGDSDDDLLENAKSGELLNEYFRLQPDLEHEIKFDDTDAIEDLVGIAEQFVSDNDATIQEICDLL